MLWIRDIKDPDPRIRTTDKLIRIRIRILFFSSVADKMPSKNIFSKFLCLILFEGTLTSILKDIKVKKKSQDSRKQGFLTFFVCLWKDSDP